MFLGLGISGGEGGTVFCDGHANLLRVVALTQHRLSNLAVRPDQVGFIAVPLQDLLGPPAIRVGGVGPAATGTGGGPVVADPRDPLPLFALLHFPLAFFPLPLLPLHPFLGPLLQSPCDEPAKRLKEACKPAICSLKTSICL